YYVKNDIPARSGLGSSPSYYPYRLPDFLRKINFQGNIYNSNIMGGFYLLHSYPERRPLTDGRWEIYNDRILKSILIAPTQPYLMQGIVSKFNIKGMLLHHGSEEAISLLPKLRNTKKWRLVYYDYSASFWIREDSLRGLKTLDLGMEGLSLSKPERFEECHLLDNFLRLMGADRLRMTNLQKALGFRIKTLKKSELLEEIGKLQLKLEMPGEAEISYQKLSDIEPKNITALTQLAIFAARRGDLAAAENFLYRALETSPDNKAVKENYENIKAARQSRSN
ncbi:MAG: hypothetical protein IMF07_07570, partial [Proteobacteria bacterium]|nr:hypothetical protein [Pseudomonadota bacterium]